MVPSLIAAVLMSGKPLTIMLAGDIMLNGISIKQKPFRYIECLLKPACVAVANLEIPLTGALRPTPYKSANELKKRSQFILKADPAHADAIKAAGIDLVTLGNNHCMDYRLAGLAEMSATLRKRMICFAGAGSNLNEALRPGIYVTSTGERIGLISALAFVSAGALTHCTPAAPKRPGIATLNFCGKIDAKAKATLKLLIDQTRSSCDYVIVGLHWGIERQSVPTPYQVELGRACIDAGADLVWGNHPHVLQGGELYRGKPIVYSMGNLVSCRGGTTGLVKLVIGDRGFERALFLPLRISDGQVRPVNGVPGQQSAKAYKGLCRLLQKRYPSKFSKPLL